MKSLSLLTLLLTPIVSAQVMEQTSLSPILMFVSDRASADAAAPRIHSLLEQVDRSRVCLTSFDRLLLRCTACYGSEALQQVMNPFIPPPTQEELEVAKLYQEPLREIWQAMDDLTVTLQGVNNKKTADAAADMLEAFVPFMVSCSEKLQAVTPSQDDLALSVHAEQMMLYYSNSRPHVARLLQAWGALAMRSPEYYRSERLVNALLGVRDVLENMNMQVDPDALPGVVTVADKILPLMKQWIAVAALVHDKVSADAASIQLTRLHTEMREIALRAGLSRSYEEDLFLYSPELEIKVHVMDRICHYFQSELNPPFFGSSALRDALQHED